VERPDGPWLRAGGEPKRTRQAPKGKAAAPAKFVCNSGWNRMIRGDGIEKSKPYRSRKGRHAQPPWKMERMLKEARGWARAPAEARVTLLAWSTVQDNRPLRNDHAFVIVDWKHAPKRHIWVMVSLYRHSWNKWWNASYRHHARPNSYGGIHCQSRAPRAKQAEKFLADNDWMWKDHDSWKVLAGNVLDRTWHATFGSRPRKLFAKGIEAAN